MKKIAALLLAGLVLAACNGKKDQQKATLDQVLKIHDKVMSAEGRLMDNKMKLDTLLKQPNLPGLDTAKLLFTKLALADSAMDTWMHNFDPDHKGKTDDETSAYIDAQKKQIMAVDSQINAAVAQSDKYLEKFRKK